MPAKILIVDDDPDELELLNEGLGDMGFYITFATSEREVLALVQKNIPDVIILNLMMPGMSGFDIYFHLKRNPSTRNVPVIIVSAYGISAHAPPGVAGVAMKAESEFIAKVRQMVTDILASSLQ